MDHKVRLPGFLRDVRDALKATDDGISTLANEPFNERSPGLRRLVEEIHFSLKFVPTYYAVLGVLVLAFSARHRYQKQRRRHRRQLPKTQFPCGTPTSSSNASSDTTVLPSENNSVKDVDAEQIPLLHEHAELKALGAIRSPPLWQRLRALLTYQPEPVPAITAPSNHLPENGTTLLILLLLAINLFYLFYHMPLTIPMLFAFADRASLCLVVNLPILYILAAKTNQPLQFLTGWSYEGLNIFHRRLGEWMIALAAIHGVGMFGVWLTLLRPFHFTFLRFLSSKTIWLGLLTLVAYLAIYISSIGWVRRLYYETFLGLHIVLQVAALALLFFHHPRSRTYVLVSLAIWTTDRMLSRLLLSKRKIAATLQIASDQTTVLMFCDVPIHASKISLGMDICNGWRAGQHIFITIPGLGWRHKLQAHPFSIASPAPPSDLIEGSWPLQLTVRAQNGFSHDLIEFARFHQHCEVWIDGPYGSADVLEAVQAADRVCFVAGGSGIAVTYPLCWAAQFVDGQNALVSARTVYECGTRRGPKDLHYEEVDSTDRCAHLWIRQYPSADDWISYFPRNRTVLGQSRLMSDTEPDPNSAVQLVTSKFETSGIHSLRPDIRSELREWLGRGPWKGQKIVMVVSGPDGLVRDARNAASSFVQRGHDIEVHVEKFGW